MNDYGLTSKCGRYELYGDVDDDGECQKYWHIVTDLKSGVTHVLEHSPYEKINPASFQWYIDTGFKKRGWHNKEIEKVINEQR